MDTSSKKISDDPVEDVKVGEGEKGPTTQSPQ